MINAQLNELIRQNKTGGSENDYKDRSTFFFGGKDGFGICQMVEDVVMKYDKETVMPHALKALNNESENVKYWCIQIISNFPDNRLFKPLVKLLELEDEDIKNKNQLPV